MIYLDNAATSFPKPNEVYKSVYDYMKRCGASFGRGGYKSAAESIDLLWEVREKIAGLLGAENPERVVFTKNTTEALNLAIKGCLQPGADVIISPLEHNSVLRPVTELGCRIRYLPLNKDGSCNVTALREMLGQKTDMVIITHASNVSGAVNDITAAAEICADAGVPLLADCAQSAGKLPICGDTWNAMVAFAGHKGFMGPQGTGGLYIPEKYKLRPLITGGTGSNSEMMSQPDIMPDKFESGTLNMAAICGLGAACDYIMRTKGIHEYELSLAQLLTQGLMNIKGIRVLCAETANKTAVVSFYSDKTDTSEIGNILDSKYNIAVRCGLHCAPLAHKTYGTMETGTVRVSPGMFNTRRDIDKFLKCINNI